jgi:predicted HTH domain antitoxin
MSVHVEVTIPEEVLNNEGGEAARRVLEEFALAGYQSGQMTAAQVRRLLGFSSRYEVDGFLKAHGVYLDYNLEDFEQDLISNRELSDRYAARKTDNV